MSDVAEAFGAGAWRFTEQVADEFPAHVRAQVPFYDEIQSLIWQASDWLVPAGAQVADLGAATGITCAGIAARHPDREIRFALYDTSAAMLKHAAEELRGLPGGRRSTFHERRVQDGLLHSGAALTLALFTLQFLPAADRVPALRAARESAAPGGALLVAEKVRLRDSRWAEIACDVSHDWKAAHGVSDAAIRAKAAALRGVLVPSTPAGLAASVRAAGWRSPETLFAWHQWQLLGAFAGER